MRAVEAREQEDQMNERIVPKPPREAVMDPPRRVTMEDVAEMGATLYDKTFGALPAPLPAFLDKGEHLRKPKSLDPVSELLHDRGKVHGQWTDQARTTNELKDAAHRGARWKDCTPMQQEAIDMLLTKIGRIVNGDPSHADHWNDIEGYARLGGGG